MLDLSGPPDESTIDRWMVSVTLRAAPVVLARLLSDLSFLRPQCVGADSLAQEYALVLEVAAPNAARARGYVERRLRLSSEVDVEVRAQRSA